MTNFSVKTPQQRGLVLATSPDRKEIERRLKEDGFISVDETNTRWYKAGVGFTSVKEEASA